MFALIVHCMFFQSIMWYRIICVVTGIPRQRVQKTNRLRALGWVKCCHRKGQSVRKLSVLGNDRVAGESTVAMTTLQEPLNFPSCDAKHSGQTCLSDPELHSTLTECMRRYTLNLLLMEPCVTLGSLGPVSKICNISMFNKSLMFHLNLFNNLNVSVLYHQDIFKSYTHKKWSIRGYLAS